MYKEERDQIREELSKGIARGIFSCEDQVIVFGAGDYCREIVDYLRENNVTVSYIIDNDKRKQNSFCRGIRVISPEESISLCENKGRYIICSFFFWREMVSQLSSLGISDRQITTIILDSFGESLKGNIASARNGKRIYNAIKKKNKHCRILLCPYTGTGDVYLIGTFLDAYLQKERTYKYVLVVRTGFHGACWLSL